MPWSYPRKTWQYAKRPVFIDLGDEYLYWTTEGLGSSKCSGMAFSKRQFIEKYGGNFEVYKHNFLYELNAVIEEENRRINMTLKQMGW